MSRLAMACNGRFALLLAVVLVIGLIVPSAYAQCPKTWTSQSDFDSGTKDGVDSSASPGNLKLARVEIAAPGPTLQPGPEGMDANINAKDPSVPSGNSTKFLVGMKGGQEYRGLIQFDLSAITQTPFRADLDLWGSLQWEGAPKQISIEAYRVTSPWAEAGVTWTTEPTVDPTPVATTVITPPSSWN